MTARQAIVEAWRRHNPKADIKGATLYADMMAPFAAEGLKAEVKAGCEEAMITELVNLFKMLDGNPELAQQMLEETQRRVLRQNRNQ